MKTFVTFLFLFSVSYFGSSENAYARSWWKNPETETWGGSPSPKKKDSRIPPSIEELMQEFDGDKEKTNLKTSHSKPLAKIDGPSKSNLPELPDISIITEEAPKKRVKQTSTPKARQLASVLPSIKSEGRKAAPRLKELKKLRKIKKRLESLYKDEDSSKTKKRIRAKHKKVMKRIAQVKRSLRKVH